MPERGPGKGQSSTQLVFSCDPLKGNIVWSWFLQGDWRINSVQNNKWICWNPHSRPTCLPRGVGDDLHPGGLCVRQHDTGEAHGVLSNQSTMYWAGPYPDLGTINGKSYVQHGLIENRSPNGPLGANFLTSDAFRSVIVRQHHPELSGVDGAPDPPPPPPPPPKGKGMYMD